MSRIMKIISVGIPDMDKNNEAMKLRIKRRRKGIKTQDQNNNSEQQSIDAEGNIIIGGRKSSKPNNTSTQSKSGTQDNNDESKNEDGEAEAEISPLENLLIYLEDNINNLYKDGGKIIDMKNINRGSILDILDSIPQSVLARFEALCAEKISIPVQTDESFLADNSASTGMQKVTATRRMTIRGGNPNMLAKTLMKFMGNK